MIPEPPPYQLASVGAYDPETTGALGSEFTGAPVPSARSRPDFPAVNRRLKGDLLVTRPREDGTPPAEGTRDLTPGRVKTVSFPKPAEADPGDMTSSDQPATYALASLPPSESARKLDNPSELPLADTEDESNAAVRLGRLYFGNTSGEGARHHPALASGRGAADRGAACARSRHQADGFGVPAGRRFQFRDGVGHA